MRVLVADDHAETRQLLVRTLGATFRDVKAVATCHAVEEELAASRFDVLVLDVMMPDGSGIELCARLRAQKIATPVLLLTARGEVRDRVEGLDAGADDYLSKPFAIAELCARVKALGRRGPVLRESTVTVGPLVVDLESRRVRVGDRVIPLTARELAIVEMLAARPRRVVERSTLIESIWGDESLESSRASLDVLVGRIRRKLGSHGSMLQTVRGVGYLLGEVA
jgi:two-component system, OmpR family, response regulator